MDDMTFDTLAAAQSLREAGFEDRQAEAVAETVRDGREGLATQADRDTLATKADIAELRADNAELRAETREKFAALETMIADLRTDNAEREARLFRWIVTGMIGLGAAGGTIAGVIVAVLR